MKAIIGITREPEETVQSINKDYRETGESVITGPFYSVENASEWLNYMLSRNENLERVALPSDISEAGPVYGIVYQPVGA